MRIKNLYTKRYVNLFIYVLILLFLTANITSTYAVSYIEDKQETFKEIHKNLDTTVNKTVMKSKELFEEMESKIVRSERNVSAGSISVYTNLSTMNTITANDINKIINHWCKYNNSPFKGKGQIFIDASKITGLDPVYILAHAAEESAWGTSYYATHYHNYYGIGAYDDNPDHAIKYSNSNMYNGIINGAKFIKTNYYNKGQTNLYSMRYNHGKNEYCTSKSWIYNISNIIIKSYSLVK